MNTCLKKLTKSKITAGVTTSESYIYWRVVKARIQLSFSLTGLWQLPRPIIIEWAHRALFARPPPVKKLRPIIIRSLKYQDRGRVLRAAASKERNTIQHDGTPVMLFPDMSPAVARHRRKYDQVKKQLAARKILFVLQHWEFSTTIL